MDPEFLRDYITEAEFCRQRGISRRTAQRERRLRKSPPFVKLGAKVYYKLSSVERWLASRERKIP